MDRNTFNAFSKLLKELNHDQIDSMTKRSSKFKTTLAAWKESGATLLKLKKLEKEHPDLDWDYIYTQSLSN